MAFDYNEIPSKTVNLLPNDPLYREFNKITDIPEFNPTTGKQIDKGKKTIVEQKGYWESDRYFTMHLDQVLCELGMKKVESIYELHGNRIVSSDVNTLLGELENAIVLCLSFKDNLEAPIKVANFKEDYKAIGQAIMENSPIIVFQQYDGPITATYTKSEAKRELDQEAYKCFKDAVVFRGVFKAKCTDGDKYQLEKIFDKYFFNIESALDFDTKKDTFTPIPVKLKEAVTKKG